jgi:uncharacterized protein YdcH (DUF465 family)
VTVPVNRPTAGPATGFSIPEGVASAPLEERVRRRKQGGCMDPQDETLIAEVSKRDDGLKKLWDEHRKYEQKLEELNGRAYLTSEEAVERKRLQKVKLIGKDKIEAILRQYR